MQRFACLILHPSAWVRRGALGVVGAAWARLGWPQALIRSAPMINPLLRPEAGDALWHAVAAALATPPVPGAAADDWEALSALGGLLAAAAIPPMGTAQFDAEVERAALAQLRATAPVAGKPISGGPATSDPRGAALLRKGGGPTSPDAPPPLSASLRQFAVPRSRRDIAAGMAAGTLSPVVAGAETPALADDVGDSARPGPETAALDRFRPLLASISGALGHPAYAIDATAASQPLLLLEYQRQLLGPYIDDVAGPSRVSAACDTRLRLRASWRRAGRGGGAGKGRDAVARAFLAQVRCVRAKCRMHPSCDPSIAALGCRRASVPHPTPRLSSLGCQCM